MNTNSKNKNTSIDIVDDTVNNENVDVSVDTVDNNYAVVPNLIEIAKLLEQSVRLQNSSEKRIDALSTQINTVSKQMGVVSTQIQDLNEDMNFVKGKIKNLEDNTELTSDMRTVISNMKDRRIRQILPTDFEYKRYAYKFHWAFWGDMRKFHGVKKPWSMTPKYRYQEIIDATEAWVPSDGIEKIKQQVEKDIKAKIQNEEYNKKLYGSSN